MIKLGHRGAKGHIAENTIESIQKGISLKMNGFEIDVHKCKTGEIVVHHDFMLDRTTNGQGEITTTPFSVIKGLLVEGKYKIPTLEAVLDLVTHDLIINIELKGIGTAKATAAIVKHYIDSAKIENHQIIVSSFQKTELLEISQISPNLQLGVLTQASVTEALSFAIKIKAYSIHPNFTILSPANVVKAQQLGFKVFTWTVNEKRDILRMKDYKVDGIISDFPDRL